MKQVLLIIMCLAAVGCSTPTAKENAEVSTGAGLTALNQVKTALNYIDSIHQYLPREQWSLMKLEDTMSKVNGALATVEYMISHEGDAVRSKLQPEFQRLQKRTETTVLYPDDAPAPTAVK